MRRRHLLGPAVAILILVACSSDDDVEIPGPGDSGADAPTNKDASTADRGASSSSGSSSSSSGSPFDASKPDVFTPGDSGSDTGVEEDGGADSGTDGGADSSTDGGADSSTDGGADSGTDSGSVPATITLSVSATCETVAEGYCDFVQRCTSAKIFQLYGGDVAGCRAKYARDCSKADVADGAHAYSDADANTCATALKAAACDADIDHFESIAAACNRVGTHATGASCEVDEQCASGNCDVVDESECGTCIEPAAENQPCNGALSNQCAAGTRCLNGTCKKPVAPGAACPSGDSRECPGVQRCVNGTCGAALAEGADCTQPAGVGTFNGPCDANQLAFCSTTTQKCTSFGVAAAGGDCSLFSVFCRGDERCVFNGGGSFDGKCFPRLDDGQTCNDDGEQCKSPAACVSSTCAVRNASRCR